MQVIWIILIFFLYTFEYRQSAKHMAATLYTGYLLPAVYRLPNAQELANSRGSESAPQHQLKLWCRELPGTWARCQSMAGTIVLASPPPPCPNLRGGVWEVALSANLISQLKLREGTGGREEGRLQKITGKKSGIHSCGIGRRCRRFYQRKKTRQRHTLQVSTMEMRKMLNWINGKK